APAAKPVPPPAVRSETARKASAAMPTPPPAAGSVPPPPPGFASLPPGRMQLDTSAKELWAFAPLAPADSHAFQQGCDLLVQLVAADGQPVALLTLVDRDGHVVRTAFDPVGEDGRALLKRLERSFRLKVAFFVEGRARDVQTVSALRESAVRAVRERIEALGAGPAARAQLDAVLADPPPHRDDSLPFVPTRPQTATTARVLAAVQSLEVWNEPDKLDEALLLYSVPKHVVEASSRRILRSAQSFGIALSVGLAQLAVRLGVVQDRSRLLQDQMQSFRQRIERGENDLDAAATLQNWGRLFAAAEQLSLEVEPHYRELSDRAALDAGVQPLPSIPPGGARELQAQLSDRGKRLAAIEALCAGGHVGAIGSICEVLDELRPDEVPLAVVHLLSLGEHAGDGLIAGLGSRSQFVRQACALGLGQLRLQRALPPLLRQLQSEPTSSWSELARALGDFGPAALPAIVEGLQGAERPERLMVGLAHVANHGGALDVENLENFQSSVVASAARQALSRRERMDAEDHAVRDNGALRDNSPEARFSQSFYAAVAGRAA
ncbi:MAG: hypothetical protein OXT09_09030, partial [Myxococcales bacterium]|nr:hypothetical protein [Myxococcales bacterium]